MQRTRSGLAAVAAWRDNGAPRRVQPAAPGSLVGRDEELSVLLQALDGLHHGVGRCVAVAGEAGIGKSRLLEELASRAEMESVVVLQGRAADFEQDVPFAVAIDALDEHLCGLDEDWLERALGERSADLGAVFPSLARAGRARARPELERHRCHVAVRALLESLAADRPIVIVLDDVHWADEASVELLAHLLWRGVRGPALIVLAFRSDSAPAMLVQTVEVTVREGRGDLLELPPLTRGQAEELLGDRATPEVCSLLFAESGGNPFYLEQLARTPVAEAARRQRLLGGEAEGPCMVVPDAVRASLAQELDRLSAPARDLAQAAAVLGDPFEPDVAAAVAELGEPEALMALDEVTSAGVVRGTAVPRRFAFRHPIVSRAVYESAGEGWRLAAHARAAAALRARAESALVTAPHVERSARTGDDAAVDLLLEAARAAVGRAPATAARRLRSALLLVSSSERERRLDVLVELAAALASSGQPVESRAALSEALAMMPTDASERRVRVASLLAQTESFLGRDGEAHAVLRGALELTGDDRAHERAALTLELAVDHLRGEDRDEAARYGRDALDAARRVNDRALQAAAAALLGWVEVARGDVSAARARVAEAATLVDAAPNRDLAAHLTVLFHLSAAESQLGEHEAALRHGERGLVIARATGQTLLVVPLMLTVGWSQLWLGRLEQAAQSAEALLDAASLLAIDQCLAWACALSAWVAIQRGDVASGVTAAERAVDAQQAAPRGLFGHLSQCILGEAHVAAGAPERGRSEILARAGGPELTQIELGGKAHWYGILADAELALGRVDAARRWVDRAQQAVAGADLPAQRATVQRSNATVLLAEGSAAEAEVEARQAAEQLARLGLRTEAARATTVRGRAHAALGDTAPAIEALETAHREHGACGALRGRDEAAHELRRLAQRVPRGGRAGRAGDGLDALSGREREVADLVAEGHTNKAIGATLFLSDRTIENHISHIFGKLGVSSRAEIAREVARAGLAG